MVREKLGPKPRPPQTLYLHQGKEKLRPWSEFLGRENSDHGQKNPRAHKNKIGTSPPQKTQNIPPPQNAEFYGHGFSCRKSAFFQVSIKLAQPFPAPELRTKNFTDTRISERQSITQKGVHTHPLTAREREHWVLQHLSHFIAVNFGRQ